MEQGAIIDPTGCYRYLLWREWESNASRITFIMLNPSRADATVDDPTIRRCLGFAQDWGYGSLYHFSKVLKDMNPDMAKA